MIDATSIMLQVLDAVAQVGATVTVTTYADVYNNATGKTTRTATQRSVLASPLYNASKPLSSDTREPGTSSVILPASGLGFVPQNGNKLTVAGRVYSVVRVVTHTLQSSVLAYELELTEGAP